DVPRGKNAVANDINKAGQIVGSFEDTSGVQHGFLQFPGAPGAVGRFTTLDDPLATLGTSASGINDAGQIVGSFQTSNSGQAVIHGFLLSGGTYFTIDDPLASRFTAALGINTLGQIVGAYADASTDLHAFLMVPAANPPVAAGTTADMILRHDAD